MQNDNSRSSLGAKDQVDILIEEYRALYTLAVFRMASLDRRLPATSTAITAMIAGIPLVSPESGPFLLVGVPLALLWLVKNTINHARSLEDILRRIEELEHGVNRIAGKQLLYFQSCHPSRYKAVGGRTGRESVTTVLASCLFLLGTCLYVSLVSLRFAQFAQLLYGAYLFTVALVLIVLVIRHVQYRYRELVAYETSAPK